MPRRRINSATDEQKGITQAIYTDSEPPSRMPNSLMPSAKLRSANLPFLRLWCDAVGNRTPASSTPSGRSKNYAMQGHSGFDRVDSNRADSNLWHMAASSRALTAGPRYRDYRLSLWWQTTRQTYTILGCVNQPLPYKYGKVFKHCEHLDIQYTLPVTWNWNRCHIRNFHSRLYFCEKNNKKNLNLHFHTFFVIPLPRKKDSFENCSPVILASGHEFSHPHDQVAYHAQMRPQETREKQRSFNNNQTAVFAVDARCNPRV